MKKSIDHQVAVPGEIAGQQLLYDVAIALGGSAMLLGTAVPPGEAGMWTRASGRPETQETARAAPLSAVSGISGAEDTP